MPRHGRIELGGEEIDGLATRTIVRRGVGAVPEDRDVFAGLSVEENLRLAERDEEPRYDLVSTSFPSCASAGASAPGRSQAGSSRCSRSRVRC